MTNALPPKIWFQRIAYVAEHIETNEEGTMDCCLRHMIHLAQLAPGPLGDLSRPRIEESAFEVLVAAGKYDVASLGMISDLATCAVRYDEQSKLFSAAIGLSALAIAVEFDSHTVAHAVLKAWVQCFLAVNSTHGGKFNAIGDALQHTDQLGQPQPPTEH